MWWILPSVHSHNHDLWDIPSIPKHCLPNPSLFIHTLPAVTTSASLLLSFVLLEEIMLSLTYFAQHNALDINLYHV